MTPWSTGRPPRRWQREALAAVLADWRAGRDAGLVSAIMGAGKTALVCELCAVALHWGWSVVVSVPSSRLVSQTVAALADRLGACGQWDQHRRERGAVTVACVDSLPSLTGPVDLWICDEAHGSESDVPIAWCADVAPEWRLGLSATPYRADEAHALSLFTHVTYAYTAGDAVAEGVLVPWRLHRPRGDGERVDLDDACAEWIATATGPGIVSADDIADAEAYAAVLSDRGVRALAVHSRMPRRAVDARIEALRTGELSALVHVALLVEGVDLPWLRWLCLRRRRGSRVAFAQEVGRVLRAHDGKTFADIFDPHDLFGLHSLSEPARLGDYLRPGTKERAELEKVDLIDPLTGEVIPIDAPARERKRVRTATSAASYIADAAAALRASGIVPPDPTSARQWRTSPMSDRQAALLARSGKFARVLAHDAEFRDTHGRHIAAAYRAVLAAGRSTRAGVVSDLLCCVIASYQSTRAAAWQALDRYGVSWPE